jgi:DNA polymerase-3 subunit beta
MKITLDKALLLEHLHIASRFTSNKLSSTQALQGVLLKGENDTLHFYSTNLSSYFHSHVSVPGIEAFNCIVDPKKIAEFIGLTSGTSVEIEVTDKQLSIHQGKTKGVFPLIHSTDFPIPPQIQENLQKIQAEFFTKNLPFILFSASGDDTRPTLTGINFVTKENLVIVATDGFRLSLLKTAKTIDIPSVIIPAVFLNELLRTMKDEKEIDFAFSLKEKMVLFRLGSYEFFSRLIEGDFPPFERVVPAEKNTTVVLDKEELLRNIRMISVFARDASSVIVLDFQKGGLYIRPKVENSEENVAFQEISLDGEDQKVAFNFKFVIDFLNNVKSDKVTIELVRSNAPVVFRTDDNKNFLHIIMPVRIQE